MKRAIHIFYKDLNFHQGVYELALTHQILPIFLWSEHLNQDVDLTPSLKYRLQWAKAFNKQLLPNDVNLLVVDSDDEIERLCKLYQIDKVTMLRHYEPREVAFQKKLANCLSQIDVSFELLDGYAVCSPERILKKDGSPYSVFTPYYNVWRKKLGVKKRIQTKIHWVEQPINPNFKNYGYKKQIENDFSHFTAFMDKSWCNYIKHRDYPAKRATSGVSTLLNHGLISVNDVVAHALSQPHNENWEAYLRQLAWRDFYMMIMYYHPETATQNFRKNMSIKWSNQAIDYYLWCQGKTGYPLVDAAMRHLYETGRMHNRLRMVVANFLTKDLLVHWLEGANWFKEHLIDYDLASNIGGWQWSASTGVDAAPYFRMFNPTTQSEKYDPDGDFIRANIKDLAMASSKKIHAPQQYAIPYIAKCVEHQFARKRVFEVFKKS